MTAWTDALDERLLTAWEAKDWLEVDDLLTQVISADTSVAAAWHLRGAARTQLGLHEAALADRHKALELQPASVRAHSGLCWSLIQAGRWNDAQPICAAGQALDPMDKALTIDLASTYLLQGNKREAWRWYEQAIGLIDSEKDLSAGLLGDIWHYERKGWQVELVRAARTELESKARIWLAELARAQPLFEQAAAYDEVNEHDKALHSRQQRFRLLSSLLAEGHPRIAAMNASIIDTQHKLANQLVEVGKYGEAIPHYEAVLRAKDFATSSKSSAENAARIGLLIELAWAYQNTGDFARALPNFRRAVSEAAELHGIDHPITARCMNDLAGVYRILGRYSEALPLQQRALEIAQQMRGLEHRETAIALNDLAELYRAMGRYAEALPLYQKAFAINEKVFGPHHPGTGVNLNNLALLYFETGRFPQAVPLLARAQGIFEVAFGAGHPFNARIARNQARLYEAMGRYAQAHALYQQALAITEQAEGSEHPNMGMYLNNLAGLYRRTGQNAESRAAYYHALAIANLNELVPVIRFEIQRDYAEFLYGVYRDRRAYFAREATAKLGDTERATLNVQRDQAIFFGKLAVNTFQGIREGNQALDRETQQSLIKKNQAIYEQLADWLIAAGRLAEAEEVLALLKQQELKALTRQGGDQVKLVTLTGSERGLAVRYEQLAGESARTFVRQEALKQKQTQGFTLSNDEVRELAALGERTRAQRAAFESYLSELQAALSSDPQAAARERDQLQRQMKSLASALRRIDSAQAGGPGTRHVGLHYVVTDERLSILVALADRSFARQVPVTAEALRAQVAALRKVLDNPLLDPKPAAQALYQSLIAPVAADLAEIKPHTLVLSLTDQLRYAPFAALWDAESGHYLIERYALALYTPAGGGEARPLDARGWSVSALGVTRGHSVVVAGETRPFDPLPAVGDELRAIVRPVAGSATMGSGVLPGEIALDPDFTRPRFEGALTRHPVLHVSTHFTFKPGSDDLSYLLLGDGGVLSLAELKDMPFEKVELLTLSACNTAKGGGRNERGAEVEGLAAAVQQQGAKSVLATLWPVFDSSTALLMKAFYAHRTASDKATSAQALREAQLGLLRGAGAGTKTQEQTNRERKALRPEGAYTPDPKAPYAHPYYWAPFVLMGNWL